MEYRSWEEHIPQEIKNDSLWNIKAYRLSLFLDELGWHDINRLMQDRQTSTLCEQIPRSLGSISANIAEGYSRSSAKEKAHFYEYSWGSSRESRDWYFKCWHVLGEAVFKHRLSLISEIIRLINHDPRPTQANFA